MSEEEESSLLDLPGVEEIGGNDQNPEDNVQAGTSNKAMPSGSGYIFYMDSSMDEGEDMDDYEVESSLQDPNVSREIVSKVMKKKVHETDAANLQKELTEKYISGQMSFQDYVRQLDSDDEDDEDEPIEDQDPLGIVDPLNSTFGSTDSEWTPDREQDKKSKTQKPSKKSMDDFAQDLKKATKQQLGRKLPRLGVVRGKRKRLDPTLQVFFKNISFIFSFFLKSCTTAI